MFHNVWRDGSVRERSVPEDQPAIDPPATHHAVGDEMVAGKCVPVKQGVISRETANSKLDERHCNATN